VIAPPRLLSRIGLVVHPRRDVDEPVARLTRWALERDIALAGLASDDRLLPAAVERRADDELCVGADLVIGLGGDGTILRAVRLASPCDVPVLPVNLGRLGFLAEVELEELPIALENLASGRYFVEPRVAVALQPAGVVAYNDVALTRVPGAGPASLAVEVEGDALAEYRADALVVSTPTGSTAHSFSAGGPIVSPRLQGLVVTPVAPHTVFDRSVVIHPEESVVIRVLARSAPLLVEADGQTAGRLGPGDAVRAHVHSRSALLVRMSGLHGTSFYARARRKLQLPATLPQ
jgi:NAD+ kinase